MKVLKAVGVVFLSKLTDSFISALFNSRWKHMQKLFKTKPNFCPKSLELHMNRHLCLVHRNAWSPMKSNVQIEFVKFDPQIKSCLSQT